MNDHTSWNNIFFFLSKCIGVKYENCRNSFKWFNQSLWTKSVKYFRISLTEMTIIWNREQEIILYLSIVFSIFFVSLLHWSSVCVTVHALTYNCMTIDLNKCECKCGRVDETKREREIENKKQNDKKCHWHWEQCSNNNEI